MQPSLGTPVAKGQPLLQAEAGHGEIAHQVEMNVTVSAADVGAAHRKAEAGRDEQRWLFSAADRGPSYMARTRRTFSGLSPSLILRMRMR